MFTKVLLCTVMMMVTSGALGFEKMETSSEVLLGVTEEDDRLLVQVRSNGCTDRDSFDVEAYTNKEGTLEITVVRLFSDYCEALVPNGELLEIPFEDLGLETGMSYAVQNDVVPAEPVDLPF